MRTSRTAAVAVLLLAAVCVVAAPRSKSAIAQFKKLQPCPATGQARGPCHGYVVDHVVPLCAAGPDAPENMAWQTTEEAKAKDREEWAQCRALKKR